MRSSRFRRRETADSGRLAPPPAPARAASAAAPASERGPAVELAARAGDGLEVALLWSRSSGSVWVDVLHVGTGESLRIEAEPAHALDVYYHPFAYCLD